MKLKDRSKGVPGSYQLTLPEIAMKSPLKGTFSSIVGEFSKIVAKNPALAQKHGWPTNRVDQENWIDQRECHRLLAGGYTKFIEMESALPPPRLGEANRSVRGGVAAGVKSIVAGVGVWIDLFGNDGKVVSKEEAEKRAVICAACPANNKDASPKNKFIEKVASKLLKQYELLHEMNLHTSLDDKLGMCVACWCPTKSKVWVDMTHIKAHMIAEVEAKLDKSCWIRD